MVSETICINVIGACFIGLVVASAFYGVTTLQTGHYFMNYPKDRLSAKILVANVWILNSVHMATICHGVYFYVVKNYAREESLSQIPWSLRVSKGLSTVIVVIVQIFFLLRIFYLAQGMLRWYLCGVITVLIAGHFGAGIASVVMTSKVKDLPHLREGILKAALPLGILDVVTDVAIMIALCSLLRGNPSCFRRTKALITCLVADTVTRGIFTSVVATAELVIFLSTPRTLWFISIDFVIGKLYTFSMLVALNCRICLHKHFFSDDSLNFLQRSSILPFGDLELQKPTAPTSVIMGEENTPTTIDEAAE